MAWFRPLGVLALLISLLTLASCGQSTTPLADPGSGPQNSGAIPGIWDLDTLDGDRGVSIVGGGGTIERLGKDYLDNLVYNGTVDGNSLFLDSGAGGEHPIAWAVYRFEGLNGKRPQHLNVLGSVGSLHDKYYVGLANFSEGNWEWYGPSQLPEYQIDLSESYSRYVTALGNMYFLVVTEGGDTFTHDRSVLTYVLGDHDVLPGAPRELQASDGTHADKIWVTWLAGEGADSYEVYRRRDGSNEEFTKIGQTEGLEFADTTAEPGHFYIYKARSKNEAGYSSFSNSDHGYRGELPDHGDCPSDLVATDGTYADKVRLEWTGGPAASYKVWRKPDGGTQFSHIGNSQGASFNDTTAEPGVHYLYKVSIVSEGETCFSNIDSGYRGEGGNDACPHEVWASDGTYTDKVRLEWGGVAGSWYKIYRRLAESQDAYVHIGGTDSQLSYNDTTAEPDVHYSYKVVLMQDNQPGCHGTDVGYRSNGSSQDGCPSELGASDGTHSAKVVLQWQGNHELGYDIFRKVDGEGEFEFLAYVTGLSYYDTSAVPGVVYLYKVGLENPGGFCFSNIDSGWRAEESDEHCPTELSASDGTWEEGVHLEWNGTAGQGYQIYRRLDGTENWILVATVEELSYLDTSAEPGAYYIYKVKHHLSGCVSNQDVGHVAGSE